jgi:hypothetical protein
MTSMFVYSFETDRWKELPTREQGTYVGGPSWSHDSRYLYVTTGTIYRFRMPDGHAELVANLSGIELTSPIFIGTGWFGLTPDDRVLVLRDRGTDELYALDLAYR